jgi:hypothetical protein
MSSSATTELTVIGDQVNTGSLTVRSGSITINTGSLVINSGSITVNTNGESRVFASTFRPVGSSGQNLYIGHAGTTNTFTSSLNAFGNTSVGVFALDNNTTGHANTAVGRAALDQVRAGYENTAVGFNAGNGIFNSSHNVAIGSQAFNSLDAWYNTAVGSAAGFNAQLSTASVYIGYNTLSSDGTFTSTVTNEIVIGANTTGLGSNSVVLGNSSITKTILRGKVGIGVTLPTVALDIAAGSIKAGSNTATEGTVILQDYYTAGNLTNFGTNRSSGGPVISYACIPNTATSSFFTSTYSSAAGRSAIILENKISFYTTASQTVTSGSAIGIAERVRITDTGQLVFYRYTATSSFPGTVAAVLAVDSSGNVITTAASGSAGGGSGTPGGSDSQIQYNNGGVFGGASAFIYDDVNGRVGINTNNPTYRLTVSSSTEDSYAAFIGPSPGINLVVSASSPLYSGTFGLATLSNAYIQGSTPGDVIIQSRGLTSGSILFGFGSSQTARVRITNTGNLLLTSGSLGVNTTSPSASLHVIGNTILSGSLIVSGSTHGIAEHMILAISDETTNITTGNAKVTFRAPFAMTLTQIPRSSLSTASSSGLVTVDINENGTTILGANKLSIDANEKTSTTAATPTTLADTAIADDAEITIDIDAAGTGARGLKVTLYYIKT